MLSFRVSRILKFFLVVLVMLFDYVCSKPLMERTNKTLNASAQKTRCWFLFLTENPQIAKLIQNVIHEHRFKIENLFEIYVA